MSMEGWWRRKINNIGTLREEETAMKQKISFTILVICFFTFA